jgi:putative oxidoreductase
VTAVATRVRDITRQVNATRDNQLGRDIALLVARLALAWIFIYHGAYTLFGAFGGSGFRQAGVFFSTVAHLHPGAFWAFVTGATELLGGIAVGLGVLGRIGAAGLVVTMVGAMVTVTIGNGIAAGNPRPGGGYELNLALAALAFVVAVLGTGSWSLDTLLRTRVGRSSPSRVGAAGAGPSPRSA